MGISHKQICGKSPQALKQIYGEEAVNYIYELYDECVSKRETITSEFYVPQGPAKGWWLSSLTPLFNEQGNVTQILGNGMIITKQKELETKLQANKAQLEKIVKDHNINIKVPSR